MSIVKKGQSVLSNVINGERCAIYFGKQLTKVNSFSSSLSALCKKCQKTEEKENPRWY